MLQTLRAMPNGVRIFMAYGLIILAFLGLTMRFVVDLAVAAPVTGLGLVWMLLLAYLIFTLTLVLQRKQAGYPLSLGLATLTLPLIPLLGLGAGWPGAAFAATLALIVFRGLWSKSARAWFNEP